VEARLHKQVQSDLNRILREYSSVSNTLSDDFYDELMKGLHIASANPRFYHFDASGLRRCNLHRFPYHFLYDVRDNMIRVWVLRHDSQKPSFGMRRFKR
jgi:plasmid stabilization system protein ParE